jgi:hypothetical protein
VGAQIGPLPIVSQFPQFPYLQLKERRFVENESHHILLASAKQLIGENAVLSSFFNFIYVWAAQ